MRSLEGIGTSEPGAEREDSGGFSIPELTQFRGHLIVLLTDEEVCGEYSETNRGAENATPSPSLQR
jgi:hypothetical protein